MLRILLFLSGCCLETEVSKQLYYVKTITKAAAGLSGVKNVAADVKGGTVSFMFDPAKPSFKNIEAVIYTATPCFFGRPPCPLWVLPVKALWNNFRGF
jgi:hypothetical protein